MAYRVPRSYRNYSFCRRHEPALTVAPGAEVIVETEDCFDGQMPHEAVEGSLTYIQPGRGNPASGPVEVTGAKPGMTLVAEILDVTCDRHGVVYGSDRRTTAVQVDIAQIGDGRVSCLGREFALDPVVGVLGVAPALGDVPSTHPGPHGGNLDCCDIKRGAKVYLPVGVPGALFSCGDIHALQSDGESCGMGIEVAGEVTVRLSLLPHTVAPWPVVEAADHFAVLTAGQTLDDAARLAVSAGRDLLVDNGLGDAEAYMLESLVCDLRVNQIVNPLLGARMCIPKSLLPSLG